MESEAIGLQDPTELAEIFSLIANYYKIDKDEYREKAFANAANILLNHPEPIISGKQAEDEIRGIGKSIGAAIDEYLQTGTVERLTILENKYKERSATINLFRSIYGIGPVAALHFYEQGFRTLEDLWNKANLNNSQKIGIIWRKHINLRIKRSEMDLINATLHEYLDPYELRWEIVGSYRRGEMTSGDVDVLIEDNGSIKTQDIAEILQPLLPAIMALGPTKIMGMFRLSPKYNGHRIDILLIAPESYGAALMYFTGSDRFNVLMRGRAKEMNMRLNEHGLYKVEIDDTPKSETSGSLFIKETPKESPKRRGKKEADVLEKLILIPTETEEDIFDILNVAYLEPKDRTKTLISLETFD